MSLLPSVGIFELMLLAAIALVVVGPKDLPRLMSSVGKFAAQARNMAMEFRAGFDQMAREAELDDLRDEINELKKANPVNEIKQTVNDTLKPFTDTQALGLDEPLPEPKFVDPDTLEQPVPKKTDGEPA